MPPKKTAEPKAPDAPAKAPEKLSRPHAFKNHPKEVAAAEAVASARAKLDAAHAAGDTDAAHTHSNALRAAEKDLAAVRNPPGA